MLGVFRACWVDVDVASRKRGIANITKQTKGKASWKCHCISHVFYMGHELRKIDHPKIRPVWFNCAIKGSRVIQ